MKPLLMSKRKKNSSKRNSVTHDADDVRALGQKGLIRLTRLFSEFTYVVAYLNSIHIQQSSIHPL